MDTKELEEYLKKYWIEWSVWDEPAKDVVRLLGEDWLDWFDKCDWQEKDTIINALEAIKCR